MCAYAYLLLFTFGLIGCRADYTFIQTYHSYVNPLHNRANGICCDNPSSRPPCDTFCDNMFTLCVTHTGQALPEVGNIQSEDCPLGFLLSQTFFNSDNITFNTSAPVVFTGDIWPGSFQLLVQVVDDDINNPDDFIDTLVVNRSLSPSVPTPSTSYTSSARVFSIVLSFKVECSENFYGDDCSVLCEPRDDDMLGHFTCNSNGERVCLEGYQNPDSNCTECRPAQGCCMLNGYCVRPGECLCQDGYGGDLCTLVAEASPKSQSHHVTYIVVGIVLGVLVAVVLLVLLLLLWKRHTVKQIFWKSDTIMPGDNPVYMSSAVGGDHLSQSPPHSVASTTLNGTATQAIQHTANSVFDDDIYTSPQPPTTDNTRGVIDPYGNYGYKTITRVAGMATPPPLFDDTKYACSPQRISSDTDIDSDCQSEYL